MSTTLKKVMETVLYKMGITCDDIKEENVTFCILPLGLYKVVGEEIRIQKRLRDLVTDTGVGFIEMVVPEDRVKLRFQVTEDKVLVVTAERIEKKYPIEVI